MTKTCIKCGDSKPLAEFHRDTSYRDGRSGSCRVCACERARQWWEVNRERRVELDRRWYEANKERAAEKDRRWYENNREKAAEKAIRKRRSRMQADGSHTWSEWQMVLDLYERRCAYCGNPATERDHIVPLAKGGSDGIENIVPACRLCNASKATRLLWEWSSRPTMSESAHA